MITVRVLQPDEVSLLAEVMSGYASPQRYAVTRQESDAETIFRLTLEDLPQPYIKNFRGELTPADLESYQKIAAEGLSVGAWDAGRPVGISIAGAEAWNGTLWIWEFHVAPEYQGQGIGRRMMDALAAGGRAVGLRTMRVETQNTNVRAIRFYRRVGFKTDAVDITFYTNHDLEGGEVAVFMKRCLT